MIIGVGSAPDPTIVITEAKEELLLFCEITPHVLLHLTELGIVVYDGLLPIVARILVRVSVSIFVGALIIEVNERAGVLPLDSCLVIFRGRGVFV